MKIGSHRPNVLGPQPELPDKQRPAADKLGPQPEPPDRQLQSPTHLGPQPEPPDRALESPSHLGPQPEPPDRPEQAQIGETEKNLVREPAARLTEMQSNQQLLKTNLHLKLNEQAVRLHREQEPPIASKAEDAKLVMNENAVYTPTRPGSGELSSADSTVTVTRQTRQLVNSEANGIARGAGSDPQAADNTNTVMEPGRRLIHAETNVIGDRSGPDTQAADNTSTVIRQTRHLVNDEAGVSVSRRGSGAASPPFTLTHPAGYDPEAGSGVQMTDTSPQPGRLIMEENTVTLTSPARQEGSSRSAQEQFSPGTVQSHIQSEEGVIFTSTREGNVAGSTEAVITATIPAEDQE